MGKRSRFLECIEAQDFAGAQALLVQHIKSAEYVDPSDDYTYGPQADLLAYALLQHQGPTAFARFHEDLLHLFQEELEPSWGHLHKGHFYMRLGLGYLALDVVRARQFLELGYQEDRLLCQGFQSAGLVEDGEIRARLSPNYASLVVIERSSPSYFASPQDQQAYFAGMASLRMEVFWERHEVDAFPIQSAICNLLHDPARQAVLQVYRELRTCANMDMTFPLPGLVSAILKISLLDMISHPAGQAAPQDLYRVDLLSLLRDARLDPVLPSGPLRSFCQMVAILEKEFGLADLKAAAYPLDPVTRRRMGDGLRSLLEKALVQWAAERPDDVPGPTR